MHVDGVIGCEGILFDGACVIGTNMIDVVLAGIGPEVYTTVAPLPV
jgi:hypothetical protein